MVEENIKNKSAITILRVMSMCFIVLCHILQGLNNKYAFVFNVGVQLFFLISGYLYGNRQVEDNVMAFYKSRLKKVYVPYILFFIIFVIGMALLRQNVSWTSILSYLFVLQGFTGGITGLEHLWFLTLLMVCYIITPLLSYIIHKYGYYAMVSIALLFVVYFFSVGLFYTYTAWLVCYVAGLFIGNRQSLIKIIALFSIVIYFVLTYKYGFNAICDIANNRLSIWLHVLLACIIFSCFMFVVPHLNIRIGSFIRFIDTYSYQIYLVHHPFILGPLSMLYLTPYLGVNVLLIIVVTLVASWILKKINTYMLNYI